MEESKSRHICLEAHVLAYLGDYMTLFEESIKRLAEQEIQKQFAASSLMRDESTPGDPKYTASSRNPS